MGLNSYKQVMFLDKHSGEFNIDNVPDAYYYIAHIQSPTDGVGTKVGIHPAHLGCHYLYHNGMVKFGVGEWDTMWLLKKYIDAGLSTDCFEDVDGSFACIYINAENNEIKLFTNQTCALFTNQKCEISSTRTDGFERLLPCMMYDFEFGWTRAGENIILESHEFENIDKTYYQSPRRKNVNSTAETKS